jgi:hypothetical protein
MSLRILSVCFQLLWANKTVKHTSFVALLFATSIPMYGVVGIATTTLPNGIDNSAYSATITAPGGCYPYVWQIVSGSLPPGLLGIGTSNTDTYTITGTPTTSGTFNFTVSVAGCGGAASSHSYSVTIQAGSAPAQISAELFGMHIGLVDTNPWPSTVGIQFTNYRTHNSGKTLWSQLNPSSGVYAWSQLDSVLQKSEQYGVIVNFNFYWTPTWASSKPTASCGGAGGGAGGCYPPNDLNADGTGTDQHVKDFITAMMKHVGAGKMKYIEVWNEFNITDEWAGTIPQLVRITKDVRAIAKAYDPNIQIISPAETGDWVATGDLTGMRWLGEFLAAGGGQYVDVIGLHGHVSIPENIITRTNNTLAQMAQYRQSGKPIFDTEGSWPINQGLTANLQPGYLFREYLASLSTPTKVFYVYAYDMTGTANYWSTPNQQLTVNGNAYKLFYNWLVGSTMTSKCQPQTAGSSTWSCTFNMKDGTKAMAIWNTAVTYPNTISVTVPSTYTKYLTLHGASYSINATHNVAIGYEPIWLEN